MIDPFLALRISGIADSLAPVCALERDQHDAVEGVVVDGVDVVVACPLPDFVGDGVVDEGRVLVDSSAVV